MNRPPSTHTLFVCSACNAMLGKNDGVVQPCICGGAYLRAVQIGLSWFVWRSTASDRRFLASLFIADDSPAAGEPDQPKRKLRYE